MGVTVSVLLLSGGVDSLVILAQECREGRPVRCLTFDYGQQHRDAEIIAAERIAQWYAVPHHVVSLPRLGGSALTGDGALPAGLHYADPAQAATVVPNRNLVLLSVAASWAVRLGRSAVLFGAHAGDAAIYPDCRPAFVEAADIILQLACGVRVRAPLLRKTKRDIVLLGRELGVPFALAWSCYAGGAVPCGTCGACVERREAMA